MDAACLNAMIIRYKHVKKRTYKACCLLYGSWKKENVIHYHIPKLTPINHNILRSTNLVWKDFLPKLQY